MLMPLSRLKVFSISSTSQSAGAHGLACFPLRESQRHDRGAGETPDKAEDVALAHLNGMCAAIEEIYSPGAMLVIVSDGLVYNDLLGVPDPVVWNYGKQLRALTKARNYQHIDFARLKDLLAVDHLTGDFDDMSYAAAAQGWEEVKRESYVKDDENKRLTYCGYLKFLELDLASLYPIDESRTKNKFKKGVQKIAETMLKRGEAFARAVRENVPNHVRLSIHPSTGEDKISINVLPVSNTVTPWHSCVGFKLDGTVIAGHRAMFEEMKDMDLATQSMIFEPLYLCGIMIRPANGSKALTIQDIDALKVRALAKLNLPVVLRGFSQTKDRDQFITKAYELGKPTTWKFGLVLEEWMPFHFDGLFKTEKRKREDGSESLVPNPPRFQLFTAVTPSPKDTGFTLFASSKLLFQHLPSHLPLKLLRSLTWKPQEKTRFDLTSVEIENGDQSACDTLEEPMHDHRVCYWHTWEEGDVLVNDNISMMHTRSSFEAGVARELWRIHFD
ncbi:Clavaminate synthase-like protein [Byssothecium circinans]|uniref:Clavaminate synthase-like protein n=1 Tax=Byssothecium circinans TaxID=147558 RepID=A0A6A5TL09_9PLEO|nr:Clavaminate synthase-like protein [Byssothecium circinans]